MTEDDTFRRLKRIPYEEMRRQIVAISIAQLASTNSYRNKLAALNRGHWTLKEYQDEHVKDVQRRTRQDESRLLRGFSSI